MYKKAQKYFLTLIHPFISFSKNTSLPGLSGASIYVVASAFFKAIQEGAINTRASAISFKFFLAIFPGIIFIFTLLPFLFSKTPYLPNKDYTEFLMEELEHWMPKDAYSVSKDTVYDLLNNKRQGLLSLSFLLTLYFATNGYMAIIQSFNQSVYIEDKSKPIFIRLKAFGLVIIITLLLFITTILSVFSNIGFDLLLEKGWMVSELSLYVLKITNLFIIVSLVYFSIAILYYLAPASRKEWSFFSAGATIASVLIILISLGFGWYVNNFGQFNKLYGSIGTLIVIMLWLNLISTILLVGFELNASIKKVKTSTH